MQIRKQHLRLFIPILLGLFFSLGDYVATHDGVLDLCSKMIWFQALEFSMYFVVLFVVFELLIGHINNEQGGIKIALGSCFHRREPSIAKSRCRLSHLIIYFIFIATAWSFWLYLLRSGIFWSDTSQQILQYYGVETLSDHHPVLVTFIYGLFCEFGTAVFGSATKGLVILGAIQLYSAALLISLICSDFYHFGANSILCFIVVVFFAIFPVFPVMICSIAKDSLSIIFFLGYIWLFFRFLLSKNLSVLEIFGIVLFSIIASLTKKTMGYIIFGVDVLLCLYTFNLSKKCCVKILLSSVFFSLTVFVLVPQLYAAANVLPGGKQEMIAPIIQQVAHDVKYSKDEMTNEDLNVIDKFLLTNVCDIPSKYNWGCVDSIKDIIRYPLTPIRGVNDESYFNKFIKLWAVNSMKDPKGHLEAWIGLIDGWITFRTDQDGSGNYLVLPMYSGWYYEPVDKVIDWTPTCSAGASVAQQIYLSIQSLPIINALFFRSTWASIIPLFLLFYVLGDKYSGSKKGALLILSPVLITCLTLLIVPISIVGGEPTRYVFSNICLIPILVLALSLDSLFYNHG